jgi:phage protein D
MSVDSSSSTVRATVASPARVIEVDAKPLELALLSQLDAVTVVDRPTMPDTFTLEFRDPNRNVLERSGLAIGKRVKVSTGGLLTDAPRILIDAEVTSIEADCDARGAAICVRGYDLSHRLNMGNKSRTFVEAKYSDIATQLANEAKLTPDVEATKQVHPYVIQANQSDLAFLLKLADEEDFVCRVDGDKLIFRNRTPATEGPEPGTVQSTNDKELVWGKNLYEFRARIAAAAQVSEVEVRGWDPITKKAVIGKAKVTASHADLTTKPATLAASFEPKVLTITDSAITTQDAADAMAKSRAEQVGGAGYEVTAVCAGSSELRAGATVSVTGVDKTLQGKWTISSTRHEFKGGTYKTVVECTGRQDRSLTGLVRGAVGGGGGGGGGGARDDRRIYSLVIAIVTNNDDPEGLARVKVKFPWLSADVESSWARLVAPGAGRNCGLVWVPQVDDEVLVGFENGDMRRPYVLGGLWNPVDPPPLGENLFKEGKAQRSGMVSRKGHQIVFFDAEDQSGIALISANGKFKIALNETKDELHIVSKGKLVIEARELEIKVDSNASIQAGGELKLKGATVSIN